MTDYSRTKALLVSKKMRLLSLLGNEFDSNDFFNAFKNLFPVEYGKALADAGSYQALHVWLSKEILAKEYADLIQVAGENKRLSINGNLTENKIWRKIASNF